MTNPIKGKRQPVSPTTALILALTVIVVAICAFVARQLWQQDASITLENRIIENTQVFFLLLAACMHAGQSTARRSRTVTARLCHRVLGMLCLSILIREIDIDRLGPQPVWGVAETLIRLAGGAVWIWLLTHVYGNRLTLWQCKTTVLFSSTSVLTGLGVLLYMASWFFDKSVVPLPADRSQLWEETLQMSATICLFTASLRPIHLRHT